MRYASNLVESRFKSRRARFRRGCAKGVMSKPRTIFAAWKQSRDKARLRISSSHSANIDLFKEQTRDPIQKLPVQRNRETAPLDRCETRVFFLRHAKRTFELVNIDIEGVLQTKSLSRDSVTLKILYLFYKTNYHDSAILKISRSIDSVEFDICKFHI